MRAGKLSLVFMLVAAGGCEAVGTERAPLGTVDRQPDASAPTGNGGGTGSGPTGPVTPPPGDAGAPPPGDAGAPVTGTFDPACWANQLPAVPPPNLPASTTAASCQTAAAAAATDWSYPQDPAGTLKDDRARIVGRWSNCGTSGIWDVPHAGIEFGANGRWRFLTFDANGNLVPMAPTVTGASGNYYLLGTGQIDVGLEDPDSGYRNFLVSFSAGGDALRFEDQTSFPKVRDWFYGLTNPTELNGSDNPPPLADGSCTMVGTWDLPASAGAVPAPAATFSFDGAGNFVGGPAGSDLCTSHTMYGTYSLSPKYFEITTNVGFAPCQWWFWAAYPPTFDATCTHVTLVQHLDGCTGGRGYWNGTTTMTRRQ
jgi:hypothetical protein